MHRNQAGKWLEKYKMSLWSLAGLTLLLSFATLVVMLINLNRLEKNRYQEYAVLTQSIAESTESFIVNSQHGDFYKIIKLMTRISFVSYLAFFINDEMIYQGGEHAGVTLAWRNPGRRHFLDNRQHLYYVDQAYTYPGGKRANVVVAYSLRDFVKPKQGILTAFWLNVFGLVVFGVLGHAIYRAEWTKSRMLRAISHDAMHNFGGINGALYYLIDQKQGKVDREQLLLDLKTVRENALSIKRILENLRDHERLDRGKVKVNIQETDMAQVVQFAQASYEPTLLEKKMILESEVPDRPLLVWTDRELVKSILMNLVDNAIKYSQAHTRISIQLQQDEKNVKILVRDQGPGIPRQKWEQVFKPFVRLPQTAKVEGSGLGLSNARQLIRLLGGDLGIQASEPGQGTAFFLSLPLHRVS